MATHRWQPKTMADFEAEKSGRTLHELLRVRWQRVDWAAVQERLQSHPDEAAERDDGGCYPLHRTLSRGRYGDPPPPDIVRALLDARTGAAAATDEDGWTPLQMACFNRCGADVVWMALEAFPEAANMKNGVGRIPLHYASSREDAEVVRLLLRAHPEGVGVRNKRGELPLHFAAESRRATAAIVGLLLDEGICRGAEGGSGGATVKNNRGNTPLDEACERYQGDGMTDGRWEVVVALARAASTTTAGVTDDGSVNVTPLSNRVMLPTIHAVVKAGCPEDIVRHAISVGDPGANPGAGLERDHRGRTALAVAASMREPNLEVIKTLLRDGSGAEAARMADVDGRLPLHLAAESGWPYERGLNILLDAEPQALATRDVATHMFPFMLAAAGPRSNVDAAFLLLGADPSLVLRGMVRVSGVKRRKIG